MPYIKYIFIALGTIAVLFLLRLIIKNFLRIKEFFTEVWTELSKVAWPTRKELISSTWIVIITALLLSVFLGVVDVVFSKILSIIIV